MQAHEHCLSATSTSDSPWYVAPADNKEYTRLIVSHIIPDTFDERCVRDTSPSRT
jgi:polyphosphate kinase 2 (PPK2 family)